MSRIRFAWDPRKAEINLRKHGISFEEAQTAFYDEQGELIPDPNHSGEEDRFILIGMTARANLIVVCHCYRESDSVIRMISARKATKRERNTYLGMI